MINDFNKNNIEELYYVEKDYSGLKDILKDIKTSRSFSILGKIYLNEGEIEKAEESFKKANNITGEIYCDFLRKNFNDAKQKIAPIIKSSSFLSWLNIIMEISENNNKDNPTYFQIRNFYEQDIEMLYKYKQYNVLTELFKNTSYFANFNTEIYKYNGRFFLNNGYMDLAEKSLKKSIEIYYKDAETHYLLGELYNQKNEKKKSIESYKKSSEVNNGYYPAEKRLKETE